MLNFLNRFIQKCFKKKYESKVYHKFSPKTQEVFKKYGRGVYYVETTYSRHIIGIF